MLLRTSLTFLSYCLAASTALVRIEVKEQSEVLGGRAFGAAGPYERIRGTAFFAVDPNLASNRGIIDLKKAPRNAAGRVEFSADLYILQPRDPARGNRTILYEAPNRGGKGLLAMFNRGSSSLDPKTPAHFGDGLLLDAGYTLVWLGWQHDVPSRPDLLRVSVPTANEAVGLVRSEFTPVKVIARFPLGDSGHTAYAVTDASKVSVTVREGIRGKRQPLDRSLWKIENKTEVVLSKPAVPGQIYEVIYRSKEPPIAGLGMAAIRDLISSLKTRANRPLKHAIGFGTSQSAMLLRALVYEGFNADEKGKQVFDGIFAHVAGARRLTFHRFAQLSRTAGPLRNASFSTTDQFPFSDVRTTDRETGIADGLLTRAQKSDVVPKIIYTNSSYEYWGSLGALLHTDPEGKADLALPSTTRVYMLAGGQHGPASFPPEAKGGQNLSNFNDYRWNLRALLGRLQAWVAEDKAPPASEHPSLTAKTLIPITAYSFPAIPNVVVPRSPYFSERLDFGASYRKLGLIDNEPPRLGKAFTTFIPQADRDGIDIAGVKMPWVTVPLGTFTGWNLRTPAIGMPTELLSQTGSYIAFPRTRKERNEVSDPRLSIEERYQGETEYLNKIRGAGMALVQSGFLLERDVPAVISTAKRYWVWQAIQPTTSSRR